MKRCVICGARTKRHKGETCGPVCTKAHKAGISREAQLALDMDGRGWATGDRSSRRALIVESFR